VSAVRGRRRGPTTKGLIHGLSGVRLSMSLVFQTGGCTESLKADWILTGSKDLAQANPDIRSRLQTVSTTRELDEMFRLHYSKAVLQARYVQGACA